MYWTNYFSLFSRENKERKKRKPIDYVQLEKLELPMEIANMDKNTTKEFLKDEFSIYSSLKFKSADLKTLTEKNYHSYQIGIMIQFIKQNVEFFVADTKNVFPPLMLQHNENTIKLNVGDIVEKYSQNVSKYDKQDALRKQTIWTPMEATFLLYYSTMLKG
ncbi:MAG: hypothetical protein HY307_00855 [Arcobacter sp.]|nr:hypothetical protein [Arcobacter sp.]